jgi:hypothetical protein
MRSRWRWIWAVLGVALLATVAGIYFLARQNRIYQYTFPDNSYVRILRLDYARQSRFVRWRIDTTLPFIHRDVYESMPAPEPCYLLWTERAFGDYPVEWWVRDSHGCEYRVSSQPRFPPSFYCEELHNLPTDGQKITLQLRTGFLKPPLMEYPVQCVRKPIAYPAPDRLPITREQGGVRLTLRSIRWKATRQKWYRTDQGTAEAPIVVTQIMAVPELHLEAKGWQIAGMDVVSVYNRIPWLPSPTEVALLNDCRHEPVYRLRVGLKEPSSQREMVFEFFIRPPRKEELQNPQEFIIFHDEPQ